MNLGNILWEFRLRLGGFGVKWELRGASDQSQLYTLHTLLLQCKVRRGCCSGRVGCWHSSYVWKRIKQARGIVYDILKSIDSCLVHHNLSNETIYLLHLASMKINAGSEAHDTRHREAPPSKHLQAWRGCASHNPSRMRKKTLACQCTPYLSSTPSDPRRLAEAATPWFTF